MSDPLSDFLSAVIGAVQDKVIGDAMAGANRMLDHAIAQMTECALEMHAESDDSATLTEAQLWTGMVDVLTKTEPHTNIGVLAAAIVRLHYADLNKKGARPDA